MLIRDISPNQPDRSDVFHTSGYASAQSSDGMGATSRETFSQRRQLERQRKVVRRYNGMSHIHPTPHSQGVEASPTTRRIERTQAPATRRQSFREPPARHNPYA